MSVTIFRSLSLGRSFRNALFTSGYRPNSFKSATTLQNIYPNSSLKLTTPSFVPDPNEKFSGYIPINKLTITYSASSGPGGQNVNKVHTKVDLRFKLSEADWLLAELRDKLAHTHKNKITKDGFMVIKSDLTRSQQLNLADCLEKLRSMIRKAAETKPEPTAETVERIRRRHEKASRERLIIKREASLKKQLRQPPTLQDL